MSNRGFTLIELLMVVGILGIIALVVIPALQPYDEENLDVAAQEVAAAIRFARDEAIRTGNFYGINGSAGTQRLSVHRVDTSGALPTAVYDVRNPLDKKLYDLQFATDPVFSGVKLTAVKFYYRGVGAAQDHLDFDAWGTPIQLNPGTAKLLSNSEIKLGSGDAERVIRVSPMTGRVTVL